MKKIAIICNYQLVPNRIGGMDRFFRRFDVELKKKGCVVDWYVSKYEPFDFYEGLSIKGATSKSVEDLFLESINSKNYDVVITHFTELCTKFYKKVKNELPNSYCIAVDHNPRPISGFHIKKRIKKRIEGLVYSRYIDKFIGVSRYTEWHILNDYGFFLRKKTKVVYNGIDTSVFKKRLKNQNNRFIVASHLRHSKGIQDLIAAISLINKPLRSKMKIDIYGEGPYEDELKKLTQEKELDSIIKFKGSSSDLPNLFCDYTYMIQPTYMECFSLSILESLSANVPVITTQVGGNLEVIKDGDNGFVFLAGDILELKNILEGIIKKNKMITKDVSKEIEANYFLDKMVNEHLKLIPCT